MFRVFKNAGEKIIDNLFPMRTNSNTYAKTVEDVGGNKSNSNSKKMFEEMLKDLVRNLIFSLLIFYSGKGRIILILSLYPYIELIKIS